MSCAKKDGMEITYSFSKDMEFLNLRMNIEPETEIDSISSIYSYSFLYENEIKELYGIKINGISLDYNDNFYRIAVKTPFNMKKEGE